MKKLLLILVLLLAVIVAAQAQPLVSTSSLKVTFIPVLVQETKNPGYEEDGVMFSPTITFKLAYKVSTE